MKLSKVLNENISENKKEMLKTMETMVRDGLGLKSLVKIEPMGGGVLGYVFSNPKEGKMICRLYEGVTIRNEDVCQRVIRIVVLREVLV